MELGTIDSSNVAKINTVYPIIGSRVIAALWKIM